jgi:SAM-dependent methyltransferase
MDSDPIALGYANGLMARFPELSSYGFKPTDRNASELIDFYAEVIPLFYEPAKPAHIRNALGRLRRKTQDANILENIKRSVARIELEENRCVDRSTMLNDDDDWRNECRKAEEAYGAPFVTQDWSTSDRGETLIYLYSNKPGIFVGKNILHTAAEKNFERWMREHSGASRYITSDAYAGADEKQDLTAISHPDSSFDIVICHRVMEHILDDQKGFSELFRILTKGGFVSFSVPQAPQNPKTSEWCIPDLTHHGHVRHYGADLEDRAKAAGFRVEIVPWLLQRDWEELRSRCAYPMRIFHLHKD